MQLLTIQITTTTLPSASSGQPYSAIITAIGGSGAGYTWSRLSGSLPAGFTFSSEGSCGNQCATVVLSSAASQTTPSDCYSFTVQVTDSAGSIATQTLTLAVVSVTVWPDLRDGISLSAEPTQMKAKFVADTRPILDFAHACGFAGFDWVQIVTTDLTEPPITAGPSPGVPVSPIPGYYDPPLGGYTYQLSSSQYPYWLTYQPNFASANPYFYNPLDIHLENSLAGCASSVPFGNYGCLLYIMSDDNTINFYDQAGDPSCPTAPGSPCLAFETLLVGICDAPTPMCSSVGPSPALYRWDWATNYNGKSGGISGTRSNFFPSDPGSGTGGITITSINGVHLPTAISTNQVATTASGLSYSRVNQTFNGTLTVKNIGSSAISGPLQIVLFGMTVGVALANATANLSGTPYLTIPAVTNLAPGQSATVSVQFKNPSNATINFTPAIYSGSIN